VLWGVGVWLKDIGRGSQETPKTFNHKAHEETQREPLKPAPIEARTLKSTPIWDDLGRGEGAGSPESNSQTYANLGYSGIHGEGAGTDRRLPTSHGIGHRWKLSSW